MKREIDTAEAVRRYQAGESSTQIGEALGVSFPVVLQVLRQAGVTIRRVGRCSVIDAQLMEKVRVMVDEGEKRAVISLVLGVSESTVNKAYRMACDEQHSATS